jgi:DNA modification methylase
MSFRDRIRDFRRVRAGALTAHPANWREHPVAQQEALRGVLAEIGYADAIIARELCDGTLQILDGHLRADLDPDQEVPVLIVDLNDAEAAKFLVSHDPLAAMAEANDAALTSLLGQITTESDALQAMLNDLAEEVGADQVQVDDSSDVPDAEPKIDQREELQKKWQTEPGQVWKIAGRIGSHRLMCGDSTKRSDVARLMAGARAGLMNTDPPYGVAYANDERPNPGVAKPRVAKPRVANDDLADQRLQAFLELAFRAALDDALLPAAAWYLWHAHLTQGYFAAAAAAAANVMLHRQIIWVKPFLLLGRGQYHWKHEPCFMGWVKGNRPPDYGAGNGERNQTTVWEIGSVSRSDRKKYNHATPKPVGLFTIPIVKHLRPGEVCYEPFAGSGPQFVAAEQLGRLCYGMEIEPAYAAVILQRMEDIGAVCELAA